MRHKRIRRALVQVIRANPEGITANQILEQLDPKRKKKVGNAKHISTLLRGVKGVKKSGVTGIGFGDGYRTTASYQVNVYYYDEDEGAEI